MAGSFEIISEVVLSSNTNTITFSSIPSTYRVLKIYGFYNQNNQSYMQWRVNSGTGSFAANKHMGSRGSNWGNSIQNSGNAANGSTDFSNLFQNPAYNGFGAFEITMFNAWNGRGVGLTSRSGAPTNSNGLNSISGHSQRASGNLTTFEIRPQSGVFYAGSRFILYGAGK
jgi:hypothetical protein